MELGEKPEALFEALTEKLATQAGAVLGTEVGLGDLRIKPSTWDGKDGYVARMGIDGIADAHAYFAFDLKSAIACGGLLVMMQEKVIRERIERAEFGPDDVDAMGECVNQFMSVVSSVFRSELSADCHVTFAGGGAGGLEVQWDPEQTFACATWRLKIGEIHTGTLRCLVPLPVFDARPEPPAEEVEDSGPDPSPTGTGVELTPEETAALREATMASFSQATTVIALLPLSRERAPWEELFNGAEVPFEVATDEHDVRRISQNVAARALIIDADACAAGGLPALARLQASLGHEVPILVAASRPTRSHFVSCMAAGAASYLVKPLGAEDLCKRLETARMLWESERSGLFGG